MIDDRRTVLADFELMEKRCPMQPRPFAPAALKILVVLVWGFATSIASMARQASNGDPSTWWMILALVAAVSLVWAAHTDLLSAFRCRGIETALEIDESSVTAAPIPHRIGRQRHRIHRRQIDGDDDQVWS